MLGRKGFVTNRTPEISDVSEELAKRNQTTTPIFKFQITTRGGETRVVLRGIDSILRCEEAVPWKGRTRIDVVTEDPADETAIKTAYPNPAVPLRVLVVPKEYETPRKTLLKARALHYSTEWRRGLQEERGYVVHFDSESTMEPVDYVRMLYNMIRANGRIKLAEGPILYPLDWEKSNVVSRQLESNRVFDCFHCHLLMENPPPYHLHGSNLVVEENLLMELGWDMGRSRGVAIVAEDLVFGMRAFALKGKEIFGWSGAALLEQPPLKVKDSVRQRIRWVTGVWQAIDLISRDPEYRAIPRHEMRRLKAIVVARLSVYGMGFFAGVFSLLVGAFSLSDTFGGTSIMSAIPQSWRDFSMLLLPGLALWLGTAQIGLYKNLQRSTMKRRQRAVEHLKTLVATPVGAIIETGSALYATLNWWIWGKTIVWTPTPK